jgi:hypothetical protein
MGAPTGDLADPAWTQITTVSGRIEPVMGSEEFLNNQAFAKVSGILFLLYSYRNTIRAGDGVVDADGNQYKVIGKPEIWKNMLPHVACKVEPVQWSMVD